MQVQRGSSQIEETEPSVFAPRSKMRPIWVRLFVGVLRARLVARNVFAFSRIVTLFVKEPL